MITNPYIGRLPPEKVSLQEVEITPNLESNEYRQSVGLPLLPSTSGQTWIDAAGKGSLRSQGIVTTKQPLDQPDAIMAMSPSTMFNTKLGPIVNELTPSSTFSQTPVGVKGSLPRANQPQTKITALAKQPKVGDIVGQHQVSGAKNPLSTATGPIQPLMLAPPQTPQQPIQVKKNMNVFEQRATSIKTKQNEKIIQTANKANYILKLIQITPTTYRIDICDKFAIGSKPKGRTGTLSKQQAITEFARLKGEQTKRTL